MERSVENEIWRPIPGHGGYYEVSSLGRVRSKDRIDRNGRRRRGRVLAAAKHPSGYMQVLLSCGGRCRTYRVHRLVATAFHGEGEPGMTVNHIDGVKDNNRAENLEWVSHRDNMAHAYQNGLVPPLRGEQQGNAKLNNKQVRIIRWLRGRMTQAEIAEVFGVKQPIVSHIQIRRVWKHV